MIYNNQSNYNGGGLYVANSPATLTNVTLSGNTAANRGGGLFVDNLATGVATLNNLTLSNNTSDSDNTGGASAGGGMYSTGGAVRGLNSIVAGNFDTPNNAGTDVSGADCFGTFTSWGYNLIGRNDYCTGFVNGSNGDKVGTSVSPLNAGLAPLGPNGTYLYTHALLPDSPAFNTANPLPPGSGGFACAATDERGMPRPLGPRCDMGAFEAGALVFVPLVRR